MAPMEAKPAPPPGGSAPAMQCLRENLMLTLWVLLSALVILLNKLILSGSPAFAFPICLTMWHQARPLSLLPLTPQALGFDH
jgi:hypothetical protein